MAARHGSPSAPVPLCVLYILGVPGNVVKTYSVLRALSGQVGCQNGIDGIEVLFFDGLVTVIDDLPEFPGGKFVFRHIAQVFQLVAADGFLKGFAQGCDPGSQTHADVENPGEFPAAAVVSAGMVEHAVGCFSLGWGDRGVGQFSHKIIMDNGGPTVIPHKGGPDGGPKGPGDGRR